MNKYLEKIAGNRLVRHIAENRENFPLSRLLGLAEKGALKTPEQLLPGRNLGAVNQLEGIAARNGLTIQRGDIDLNAHQMANSMRVQNRLLSNGGYGGFARKDINTGGSYSNIMVPPLYQPMKGDIAANIRGLHSTHVNNHEAFEADEAFRAIKGGRTDTTMGNLIRGEDFKVAGHNNAAVLLRESRDMSSNPYAHISPPSTNFLKARSVGKDAKKLGVDVRDLTDSSRAVPVDIVSALPSVRVLNKEDKLISSLMKGRPYQSNPSSSEIRTARKLSRGEAEDEYTSIQSANAKDSGKLKYLHSILRGNSAYRN